MATAIRFLFSIVVIALLSFSSEGACRSAHAQDLETFGFQSMTTAQAVDHQNVSDTGHASPTDSDHCVQFKMWVVPPSLISSSAVERVTYADVLTIDLGEASTSIYRPPIVSA
ncbi:hypothetical protein [Rhizobium sp. YTU87027]|uniref:hypothetical protein n=1 Tax=Rhizobium sp. YTU87027 TaxID=3417741 RepID=UPI003D686003